MLALLQARMGSTRLPGKVLRPLLGVPMIVRQLERLRRAARLTRILVATSVDPGDDALAEVCAAAGAPVFRGHPTDVLERFHAALESEGRPAHFLRLTADCPLADPELVDAAVEAHLASGADYTHTQDGWTYPKGLDVEVCRGEILDRVWAEARDPYEREHVTPFIYRRPEQFRITRLRSDPPLPYRWTVDTPADFAFVTRIYEDLYPADPAFTTRDVLMWQERHPELVMLNGDATGP